MAFETFEDSRTFGEPVSLLLFRYGDPAGAVCAYTDAEQPILHGGITYQPIPLDRDTVKSSGTLDKSSFEIRMPKNTELAVLLGGFPPSQVVTVTIRSGHVGDTEFLVSQVGRVISGKRSGDEFILTCEPTSTSLRRPMLRRHYQIGCPHALYGSQCKANRAAATITRTVTSAAGAVITLGAGWDTAPRRPKYVGGTVSWALADGRVEIREIIQSGDTQIVLGNAGPGLGTGTTISITLGCNHQMSDCRDLHNNILNFGGQPWIPTRNPIGIVNNFY